MSKSGYADSVWFLLRISAMEVKYSFSLVAIFSEPEKVSSFIINSSGRSLEETLILPLTDRRWRHKNLESLESEIESEKYSY